MRLQSLMQNTNTESQVAVSEVLDYFLKRLSSLQSSTRKLAVKVCIIIVIIIILIN